MKNLTIPVEEEKLAAVRRYMEKKNLSLENEMANAFRKLYEKYVPTAVRDYIGSAETSAKPKAKSADAMPSKSSEISPSKTAVFTPTEPQEKPKFSATENGNRS